VVIYEIKFRVRGETEYVPDQSSLYVSAAGSVVSCYSDEDESGALQDYFVQEPDLIAVITVNGTEVAVLTKEPAPSPYGVVPDYVKKIRS